MLKNKNKIWMICLLSLLFVCMLSLKTSAATQYSEISNKWFYIKNAYTGHYLEVENSVSQAGTNVQQGEFNGTSSQKWYLMHRGNGIYMICSEVGSVYDSTTNNITINYALDVDNGTNLNGTNIHIWSAVIDGTTQTYTFNKTIDSTYIIYTNCTNSSKVVSLADNLCYNGINIHQWEYSNHSHDHWILEPVNENVTMGINYAKANYNTRLDAYPDLRSYYDNSDRNSTNFVSQCLLAGGQLHQTNDWLMKRKNTTYHSISTTSQLSNSWNTSDEWIDAQVFKNEFYNADTEIYFLTGQQIIDNPGYIWNTDIIQGDVVQMAEYNTFGLGPSIMSYYITGYTTKMINGTNYSTYSVSYQSPSKLNYNLLELAQEYPQQYFIFFDFTQ